MGDAILAVLVGGACIGVASLLLWALVRVLGWYR